MAAGDTRKVLLENTDGEYLIPYTEVASSNTVGRVKPDGTSTTVDANGVISVASAIQSGAAAGATAVQPSGVGDAEIEIQKNGTKVDSFTTNQSGSKKTINIIVPTSASDVSALPSSTKYGASIDLSLNTTDYKLTLTLKDQDGTTLNSKVVDFPIESVVVSGSYDSTNQKIVLTLQNGNTIDIPVGALISGLQSEITSSNKLDADLVDDSTSTNKFVTTSEKNTWSGKQDTSTAVTHTASTAVGSGTQPVYIASDGTATATTYSLAKSVPSDAVFTDTTYSVFTGANGTTAGTAGLVKAPAATDNTKFLKGDGTWSDVAAGATSWGNIGGTLSNQTDLNTALNGKQDTITGAVSNITSSDLTASKALVSDANGKVAASSVTSTELGYLSGVTSAIQTQLGNKANDSDVVKLTGDQSINGVKTFNNNSFTKDLYARGNITLGTSTNTWGHMLQFQDTAGTRIARVQPMAVNTTKNKMGMWVNNADNSAEYGIEIYSDGTTSAPTPATSDNSTKIATTAFVKGLYEVSNSAPSSPVSGKFYFVKES